MAVHRFVLFLGGSQTPVPTRILPPGHPYGLNLINQQFSKRYNFHEAHLEHFHNAPRGGPERKFNRCGASKAAALIFVCLHDYALSRVWALGQVLDAFRGCPSWGYLHGRVTASLGK